MSAQRQAWRRFRSSPRRPAPWRQRLAALFATACALAFAAPARAQSAALVAQGHYAHGVQLFESGRVDEALAEFRASLGAYQSPNSRLMVARCLARLGRHAEALPEFDRTITDAQALVANAPQYRPTLEMAQRERGSTAARVGRIVVSVTPAAARATLHVGTTDYPPEGVGVPLPVDAGAVAVRIDAPGFRSLARTVDVRAGEVSQVVVTLEPTVVDDPRAHAALRATADARPVARRANVTAWVVTGVGSGVVSVGSFVASAVFALRAQERYDQLSGACVERGMCASPDDPNLLEGQQWQTAANVLFWTGVGTAVLSTSLFVTAGVRRAPVRWSASPAGLEVRARF